ncbi:MAG: hypothetical protein JSU74_07470 [Candidatus Zixiibacteriota bacterium]|nr:MAG: hypothetical protein JSU74_07470 [candidate division Zixibacteria bacterium]
MKPALNHACFVLALLVLTVAVSEAVELKSSPIQDQLSVNLHQPQWYASDGFRGKSLASSERAGGTDFGKKRVSVVKAAALSALLPGLGEYYVGHRTKAKFFFGAEALTWIGFFAFRTYGGWKEDDFIRFAGERAGASLVDKDEEFQDWVGFYMDIDEFNTLGRVGDPDRPYLEDTPDNHWRWLSVSDQEAYRDIKNSSREAYRRSEFMIGVAIVNRVISVIDAVRDAKRARSRIDGRFRGSEQRKIRLSVDPFNDSRQVSLTVYTSLY